VVGKSKNRPRNPGPVALLFTRRTIRYVAGGLSGVLLFACLPSLNLHFLVWVACFPLLLATVSEDQLKHAFFQGHVCGAVFWAGSCYWFIAVMRRYGGVNPLLGTGALILFLAVFAIFFSALSVVIAWTARRSIVVALALTPFLWVSMELGRTHLLFSFPWNLLGYAVQAAGLRQIASVTGVYGLSFLAVLASAVLAWVFVQKPLKRALVVSGCLTVAFVGGDFLLSPPPLQQGKSVALLVQPNVPLDEAALESWVPWRDPSRLMHLITLSESGLKSVGPGTDAPPLIIWAENPAPFYYTRDPVFRAAIEGLARKAHAYVVFNTITFTGQDNTQPKNSAVVLDPEGRETLQYDKIHLVPFGEYVPNWPLLNLAGKITSQVGDFVPGSNYQGARTMEGAVGVFICYEAIFPQLVRRLTPGGPSVLVTISNDAWYGDSSAAYQHLNMARLRAVENGRYLLRATNDGVTAVIDPFGRIVSELPRHETATLPAHFDYRSKRTFYNLYGDVFAWLCVAVSIALLAWAARLTTGAGENL